jgi:DNA-binding MarR family transcriptional regulator
MKDAFIRFLNLKNTLAIEAIELDSTSMQLLEICMVRSDTGQRLTITQAMGLTHVASPATIHRKLLQLLDSGYVTFEYESNNRRTKYLTPTTKSEEYFAKLGSLLLQSASQ